LAQNNPLWRAPRIHGELQKLGITISERSVSRILRTVKRPPSQDWKTFLRNHIGEIVAVDFFTVPTIRLHCALCIPVDRASTEEGASLWHHRTSDGRMDGAAHRGSFFKKQFQALLIRDRDSIYGQEFRSRVQSLGLKEVVSEPRSPWQNGHAERLVGSIRRECLNHVVILSPRHLRRLLKSCLAYYHRTRTHLALAKDAPEPRAIMADGKIVAIPQVGGLHHRYERYAA
jgi:putative transposase